MEYKPLTVGDLRKAMEGLRDSDRVIMTFECLEDPYARVYVDTREYVSDRMGTEKVLIIASE